MTSTFIASMDKAKLWSALNDNLTPIEFSVGGEAPELPATPGLIVEGIGNIALPLFADGSHVNEAVIREVVALCKQAPFGKGLETFVDTDVRRTWELEASRVTFSNPNWSAGLEVLLARVGDALGCMGRIRCSPYKLLLYEAGGHFLLHRDTEKEPGMFATLVVQLPSIYTGGSLVVKHRESTHRHDFGTSSGKAPFVVHFAAHFANLEHQVEEVLSGVRVVMVYNVCWVGSGPAPTLSVQDPCASRLASLMEQWDSRVQDRLLFCLDHDYTEQSLELGIGGLKGKDREKLNLLLNANSILSPSKKLNVYLTLAERRVELYTGCCDSDACLSDLSDSDWEEGEDTVTVSSWVSVDGTEFENGEYLDINVDDSLNEPWGDDAITETDVDGYMGNEGATKTTVYHHCVVVFWPAQNEENLLLKHGGVCAGAHLLKSITSKCNLAANSEQREVNMNSFRNFFVTKLLPILKKDLSGITTGPSLPLIASTLCEVQDLDSARQFLSDCIGRLGLCSEPIASAVVCIGDKFGWESIADLVFPLFPRVTSYQVSWAILVLAKVGRSQDSGNSLDGLKHLRVSFLHLLSLITSPKNGSELPRLADVCVKSSDLPSALELMSHISKIGVQSRDIASAIIGVIHHFGYVEAILDKIPGLFCVLSGSEEGACFLLATLLTEGRDVHEGVLIPILAQTMVHLVNHGGKECASHLMATMSEFKDTNFTYKVISVLQPIGLKPGNSIIGDAIITLARGVGWPAIRNLVPMFFNQMPSFSAESYCRLLSSLMKEDPETGDACCCILAQKILSEKSICSLSAKDLLSLIVNVFLKCKESTGLTSLVSNIVHQAAANTIADLVTHLRAKVAHSILTAEPLASLILTRIETLTKTIPTIPVPSWQFPTASSMPSHHAQVVAFLCGSNDSFSLCGFVSVIDARKFVQKHSASLPVSMIAEGSGPRAHVTMKKTSQINLDVQRMNTLSLLHRELNELCAILPEKENVTELANGMSAVNHVPAALSHPGPASSLSSTPTVRGGHPPLATSMHGTSSTRLSGKIKPQKKKKRTHDVPNTPSAPAVKVMKTKCIQLD